MKVSSGFFVYKAYITYKSHFTQNGTDISKYGYNLFNISYDAFLSAKGIHFYDNIAHKVKNKKDVINLLITAFLDNPNIWIGDIWRNLRQYIELDEHRQNHLANMPYLFRKDCIYLFEKGMKFDGDLDTFVFEEFMQSNIEVETFIIYKKIFCFIIDNNMSYDYFYKTKYEKYEFLMDVDLNKYKQILKEVVMTLRE